MSKKGQTMMYTTKQNVVNSDVPLVALIVLL